MKTNLGSITMQGHQEMDGVPGISQCPIAPGHSMTYRFHADLYGTSWWHSHYSAQTTDGVYGALVIHGPKNVDYDIDLGPVFVSDYYRKPSEEVLHQLYSTNIIEASTTFADGTLISGKMQGDCSNLPPGTPCSQVDTSKFEFEAGKTHRLRFISPASFGVMVVSIDDHDMTVIANDFVPVVPYTVKTITLAAGQRMDVLVKAKTTVRGNGAYWLRVRQPTLCALAYQPFAVASIHYKGFDTDATPLSLPQLEWLTPRLLDCQSDPLRVTEPLLAFQPPEPDVTLKVDIKSYTNESGHILYFMNGHTFRANYNEPTLLTAQAGNLTQLEQEDDKNVYNFGTNQSVRIVFQNYVPFSHPMHIHGQNMYVLDEGVGTWNGQSVVRPQNPQRRDTQIIQPSGYIVVQLDSTNPGVWPFHCHFTWHVSQGLYINVVQRPDEIVARTELPEQLKEVCDGKWYS
jgi:FtsP/CotA-like multicopper oxidase with cupredoxin domain